MADSKNEGDLTPEQKKAVEQALGGGGIHALAAVTITDPILAQGAEMAMRLMAAVIARGDRNYEHADSMGNQLAALILRFGPITLSRKELDAAEQHCIDNHLALESDENDGTVTLRLRAATPEELKRAGVRAPDSDPFVSMPNLKEEKPDANPAD